MCGDLARPLLGLTREAFGQLSARADVIYHVGASVNLMDAYGRLRAVNVLGVQEILRLAAHGRTKPVHYVSTISTVVGGPDDPEVLPEDWSNPGFGHVADLGHDRAGDKQRSGVCFQKAGAPLLA